jgi:peptidoglycan/LPS O-acetylase OafA/YrhL
VSDQAGVDRQTESVRAQRGHHLIGLDGARGIACLCVISAHVLVHFAPVTLARSRLDMVLGHGLTFFFALSAFLLYLPYVKRVIAGRPPPDPVQFLRRRVLRIFPAYLAIFLIANFVFRAVYLRNPLSVGWASGAEGTGMMTDIGDLFASLTLTHTLRPSTLQTGLNPSWSLTCEWGFYLALPLIGWLWLSRATSATRPIRAALAPPAVLFALGLATQTVLQILQRKLYPGAVLQTYWGENWLAVLSSSTLAYAGVFAIGMVCAVAWVAMTDGWLASRSTLNLQWIIAGCGVVGAVAAAVLLAMGSRYVEIPIAVVSAALIMVIASPAARHETSVIAAAFDWRPVRAFGLISLSAFLWHYPVLILVDRLGLPITDSAAGGGAALLLVTGVTILLATVTYLLIEKPAMRRGR